MSSPIYAPDDDLFPKIMQFLMFKEGLQARKEDLKLRQSEFKLRQEEQASQQQQKQQQEMGTLMNFLNAAHDPATADLTQQGMSMLGNANVSQPMLQGEVNRVAQGGGTAANPIPSQIDQRREELAFDKYMKQLRDHMTPDEFSQFEAGVSLVQRGVPKELVDWAIPETLKERADRLKVLTDVQGMQDKAAADQFAQQYLQSNYNITVGATDANKTLQSLVLADRAAAQARDLKTMEAGIARDNRITQVESTMRGAFERSPIVENSQNMAMSYGKIANAAARKTGASDQALIFAFINMQDQTAARDSERAALQKAGSVANYITAKFGKWTEGEVLADEVRVKIVQAAEDMLTAQMANLSAYMDHYTKIATESGVSPDRVVYDPITKVVAKAKEDAAKIRVQRARQ